MKITVDGRLSISISRRTLYQCVIWVLVASYLLLPIERGFPVLRVVSIPLTATMTVSLLGTLVLAWESRGGIFVGFRIPYVLHQVCVAFVFVVSAMISADPVAGLFVVLNYVTTFILNLLILNYLFKRGLRQTFVTVLGLVITLAAVIGILEARFRVFTPFYMGFFQAYDPGVLYAATLTQSRVLGTLGNPLLFGLAITLSLGFVSEIRSVWLRWGVTGLLAVVSVYTVSTTVALIWTLLAVASLALSRHKWRWVVFGLLGLLSVYFVGSFVDFPATSLLDGWVLKTDLQTDGYGVRVYLLNWALEYFREHGTFVSYLFGWGLRSSHSAVYALGIGRMETLDNVYATLLFESGLVGLGSYLLVVAGLLVRYRRAIRTSIHLYVVIGLLWAGFSFTTIYLATINLIWVASVAALEDDYRRTQIGVRSGEESRTT